MTEEIKIEQKAQEEIKVETEQKVRGRQTRKRDGRIPLHKQKRIGIKKDDGFYYRLVNDVEDRISSYLKAGYELVEAEARNGARDAQDDSQMGKYASQQVGQGITAYYMKIPLEYWKEDQAEKQKRNDSVMDQIKYGFDRDNPIANRTGSVQVEEKF